MWRRRQRRHWSAGKTVRAYIRALNAHDYATIETLLDDDYHVLDSLGGEYRGKDRCIDLMRKLIEVAGYRLEIDKFIERGDYVLMSGRVDSRLPLLTRPTYWRVHVREGKLTEWQSFVEHPSPTIREMVRAIEANQPKDAEQGGPDLQARTKPS